MDVERILVTVRTYPTISTRYTETVCTAGITDAGEWRRLYPVPLRYLEPHQQFGTFNIITLKLKQGQDGRPETRRPENQTVRIEGHLTDPIARHHWIAPTIVESLHELTDRGRSIGPVAVSEVLGFDAEPTNPVWSAAEQEKLRQFDLFSGERKPLEKVPFNFRLRWRDHSGATHDSMFISWEVFETWRSWRGSYDNVVDRMREKWLGDLFGAKRQVAFFMGNQAKRRQVFMVCGTYQPFKKDIPSEPLF